MSLVVPPRLTVRITGGPSAGQSLCSEGLFCLTVGRTARSRLHLKDPSVSERHAGAVACPANAHTARGPSRHTAHGCLGVRSLATRPGRQRPDLYALTPTGAEICWDGRSWVVSDLGSSNGTLAQGVKLSAPGCSGERPGSDHQCTHLCIALQPGHSSPPACNRLLPAAVIDVLQARCCPAWTPRCRANLEHRVGQGAFGVITATQTGIVVEGHPRHPLELT